MCVLCGELIMHVHWTDRRTQDNEYKHIVIAGESQRDRMRSRLKRVKISNRILAYYGLSISEWNGSRFVLRDKKGGTQIVYDLGDMWNKAELLAHKKLDPLDDAFLDAFSGVEV